MKNRYIIAFQKEIVVGDTVIKTGPFHISIELNDPTLLAMQQNYGTDNVDRAVIERLCNVLKEKV